MDDAQAILERAHELGITLTVAGDRIRYRPRSAASPDFVEALHQCKLQLLKILTTWPPPDAADLVARWKELGRPEIPLSPGVFISNLERWLRPLHGLPTPSHEDMVRVRRFLMEYLLPGEVPQANPVLEKWRRVSTPDWRCTLQESIAQGDSDREKYARWMLRDILLDPEYEEPTV